MSADTMMAIVTWLGQAITILLMLVVAGVLLWLLLEVLGRQGWKRLQRVYHLNVIAYWLARLENEGRQVFQRPQESNDNYEARCRDLLRRHDEGTYP